MSDTARLDEKWYRIRLDGEELPLTYLDQEEAIHKASVLHEKNRACLTEVLGVSEFVQTPDGWGFRPVFGKLIFRTPRS